MMVPKSRSPATQPTAKTIVVHDRPQRGLILKDPKIVLQSHKGFRRKLSAELIGKEADIKPIAHWNDNDTEYERQRRA